MASHRPDHESDEASQSAVLPAQSPRTNASESSVLFRRKRPCLAGRRNPGRWYICHGSRRGTRPSVDRTISGAGRLLRGYVSDPGRAREWKTQRANFGRIVGVLLPTHTGSRLPRPGESALPRRDPPGRNRVDRDIQMVPRDGSVLVAVSHVSGADVVVESLGFDANLGFQPGPVGRVRATIPISIGPIPEPSGRAVPNQEHQCRAAHPHHDRRRGTGGSFATRNFAPLEQFGTSATSSGVALAAGSWLDLENGIQVQFAPGNFDAGDYWVIPARTATGEVEWPPCGGDGGAFQPPHRTEYGWLLWLAFTADPTSRPALSRTAEDPFRPHRCRRWKSLALHVTGINWNNDDVLSFDQLLATGLAVTLDDAPTGRIDSSIFDVTLEVPVASPVETAAVQQGLTPIVLAHCHADRRAGHSGISRPSPGICRSGTPKERLPASNSRPWSSSCLMLQQGISYSSFVRARVRLTGADVFAGDGSSRMYLDGALGNPGVRGDGATPRMDLTFPSGSAEEASNFTSWFFLAPTLTVASLTVQPAEVAFTPTLPTPPSPVATLTVNYPVLADTAITLSVIPPPGTAAFVTVPGTVTIPAGKASVEFSCRGPKYLDSDSPDISNRSFANQCSRLHT